MGVTDSQFPGPYVPAQIPFRVFGMMDQFADALSNIPESPPRVSGREQCHCHCCLPTASSRLQLLPANNPSLLRQESLLFCTESFGPDVFVALAD